MSTGYYSKKGSGVAPAFAAFMILGVCGIAAHSVLTSTPPQEYFLFVVEGHWIQLLTDSMNDAFNSGWLSKFKEAGLIEQLKAVSGIDLD